MKNKELLEEAFRTGNLPKRITYCFQKKCQKKDECLHYLCSLYKDKDKKRGYSIFPDALQDGECEYFTQLRVVKMAWGFDSMFEDVKQKDAPKLRERMKTYLGSNGQYYRYKLGQLKLVPEQQRCIKLIFADMGYTDVEFDNFTEELDFTRC